MEMKGEGGVSVVKETPNRGGLDEAEDVGGREVEWGFVWLGRGEEQGDIKSRIGTTVDRSHRRG